MLVSIELNGYNDGEDWITISSIGIVQKASLASEVIVDQTIERLIEQGSEFSLSTSSDVTLTKYHLLVESETRKWKVVYKAKYSDAESSMVIRNLANQ